MLIESAAYVHLVILVEAVAHQNLLCLVMARSVITVREPANHKGRRIKQVRISVLAEVPVVMAAVMPAEADGYARVASAVPVDTMAIRVMAGLMSTVMGRHVTDAVRTTIAVCGASFREGLRRKQRACHCHYRHPQDSHLRVHDLSSSGLSGGIDAVSRVKFIRMSTVAGIESSRLIHYS